MSKTEKMVVTERLGALKDKAIIETPRGDVQVVAMPWWKLAAIRTARTYLQNLLGNLTNAGVVVMGGVGVTSYLPAEVQTDIRQVFSALEFYQVLLLAMSAAVAPAVYTFVHNMYEILTKLDITNPGLRA